MRGNERYHIVSARLPTNYETDGTGLWNMGQDDVMQWNVMNQWNEQSVECHEMKRSDGENVMWRLRLPRREPWKRARAWHRRLRPDARRPILMQLDAGRRFMPPYFSLISCLYPLDIQFITTCWRWLGGTLPSNTRRFIAGLQADALRLMKPEMLPGLLALVALNVDWIKNALNNALWNNAFQNGKILEGKPAEEAAAGGSAGSAGSAGIQRILAGYRLLLQHARRGFGSLGAGFRHRVRRRRSHHGHAGRTRAPSHGSHESTGHLPLPQHPPRLELRRGSHPRLGSSADYRRCQLGSDWRVRIFYYGDIIFNAPPVVGDPSSSSFFIQRILFNAGETTRRRNPSCSSCRTSSATPTIMSSAWVPPWWPGYSITPNR